MTPAGTTHLIYDRAGNLIAEADGTTGASLREYVWLEETPHLDDTTGSPSFMPLTVVVDVDTTSPKIWYVHPDHLNRPLAMTDENGNVISDSWLPFGKVSGTAMTDARFPGQWNQLESGFAYNWHRHYDPTTGRYTQADPIGLAAGPSLYAYANGNPVNFVDPSGTTEFQISGGPPTSIPDSDAVYRLVQSAFRNATPCGDSVDKPDQFHAAAQSPLVRNEAILSGEYFITPSRGGGYSLLLQSEGKLNGQSGIYEYIVPINSHLILGSPQLTHQTFIPNAPISGVSNNWNGSIPPFGSF